MKMHLAGKTDQAKADLARLAIIRKQREEAARKKEEERKGTLGRHVYFHGIQINGILSYECLLSANHVHSSFLFLCHFIAVKEAAQAAGAAAKGLHTLSLK